MSKCVIITGANGFIGRELVTYFHAKGWKVKVFTHAPWMGEENVEVVSYHLDHEAEEKNFEGADALIHCAYVRYDKNKNADQLNIKGTKSLVEVCRRKNVKPVFISSFSAHPAAESHYGKTKLECEKLFDLSKDLIIRPGLVIGKRGLVAEIIGRIKKSTYFPLAGGDKPVQTVAVEDLCSVIETALNNEHVGLFHVAEPRAITLKEFYSEIAAQLNKKLIFIPVPLSLLHAGCKTAEALGLKLPVTSENVLGLKHLIKFDTTRDLDELNVSLKDYKESIKAVLK
jgi:nucleoside-diphosphate-sugar epimerase